MKKARENRVARVLRWMVLSAFGLNVLLLPVLPGLAMQLTCGGAQRLIGMLRSMVGLEGVEVLGNVWTFLLALLLEVWQDPFWGLVTAAYWLCGGCTAVLLWQAKRVLDTVLAGNPFQTANARALRRAAVCCWVVSGAALARLGVWLAAEGTIAPLFTYNTLFIPTFFLAGLLFLVLSTLFEEAAGMREEQELTI